METILLRDVNSKNNKLSAEIIDSARQASYGIFNKPLYPSTVNSINKSRQHQQGVNNNYQQPSRDSQQHFNKKSKTSSGEITCNRCYRKGHKSHECFKTLTKHDLKKLKGVVKN